jgi:hypothetical protein
MEAEHCALEPDFDGAPLDWNLQMTPLVELLMLEMLGTLALKLRLL